MIVRSKFLVASLVLLLAVATLLAPPVRAQQSEPKFWITWRAASYVPADFRGKVLPAANSPIVASFELVDGGRVVDLSNTTIYWYVDDELVASGRGIKRVEFRAPRFAGGIIDLRVQIPNYKRTPDDPGSTILGAVEVPVARPEAVIDAAYPGGRFTGSSVTVRGLPYFFLARSIADFVYSWNVNGSSPANAEDPEVLNIALNPPPSPGTQLIITLNVRSARGGLLDAASAVTMLFSQ